MYALKGDGYSLMWEVEAEIAEKYYGNGAKNELIFEANKPMLKSPDKIYPGQVLRIPPLS